MICGLFGFGYITFRSKATSLNGDGVGVMKEPVENSGGKGGIVVKDMRPSFIGLIGR